MQLTDEEIRRILIREKKKKIRLKKRRRRIVLLILLVLIVAVAVVLHTHLSGSHADGSPAAEADSAPARGIIFIDPGHGGKDPGSDNGARYEKEDTLKIALATKAHLEKAGFKVVLSRDTDKTVDRALRGKMANDSGAQLMVSIHRNKADGNGDGVEAYIPMGNDAESRLLAENIVKALAGEGFTERSVKAGTLQSSKEDYQENATSKMPSCLVEVGFISNMNDNKLFDGNLDNNAAAIARAVEATFNQLFEQPKDASGTETPAETADPAGQTPSGTTDTGTDTNAAGDTAAPDGAAGDAETAGTAEPAGNAEPAQSEPAAGTEPSAGDASEGDAAADGTAKTP